MSWKKTILKSTVFIGMLLLFTTMLLLILLNSAPFQNWAVDKVTKYLSEQLNTPVSIGRIKFKLFNTLQLENVLVCDEKQDTLLYTQKLKANIKEFNLEKNLLVLQRVELDSLNFALIKHKGSSSMNLNYIIKFFQSKDTVRTPGRSPFTLDVREVKINNSRFSYTDFNITPKEDRFDEAHMDLKELNIQVNDLKIINDSIVFNLKHLGTIDRCGMRIEHLRGHITISSSLLGFEDLLLKTEHSELHHSFAMEYKAWTDFSDFKNSVKMVGDLEDSYINLKEIGYFAPELKDYDVRLKLNGRVNGPLSRLRGKGLNIAFGKNSEFDGDLNMRGLPNIKETFIDLKANNVQSNEADLALLMRKVKLPKEISRLGQTSFKGRFTGFVNDFVASGTLSSELGKVVSDINMKLGDNLSKSEYSGEIELQVFNVGRLVNNTKTIGVVSLKGNVKGKGLTLQSVHADLTTKISELRLYQYTYHAVNVKGNIENSFFTGKIVANDPNLRFDFDGTVDFRPKLNKYNFTLDLYHANLKPLGFDTNETMVTANATMKATADDKFYNNNGSLYINNICITRNGTDIPFENIKIDAAQKDNISRLNVTSGILDLDMSGVYNFNYLPKSINNFLHTQAPYLFPKVYPNLPEQHCDIQLTLKTSEPFFPLFYPDLSFNHGIIQAEYNSRSANLNMKATVDSFAFQHWSAKQLHMNASKFNSPDIRYTVNAAHVTMKDKKMADKASCEGLFKPNQINNRFYFIENTLKNEVDLTSSIVMQEHSADITFLPSKLMFKNKSFNLKKDGSISITDSGIVFNNLLLAESSQSVKLNGIYANNNKENLMIEVNNLGLDLISYFINDSNYHFNGVANGNANLRYMNSRQVFLSNLNIKNAVFLDDTLGEINLSSTYESVLNRMMVDASIDNGRIREMKAKGYINLSGEQEIDIDVSIGSFHLNIIKEKLKAVFSDMGGKISAELNIGGTLKKPVLTGLAKIKNTGVKVGYLQSIFYIVDAEVEIKENIFILKSFQMLDERALKAKYCVVSGWMKHDYFTNFSYKFNFRELKDFWAMNTEYKDNELFFGKGYATGEATITGTFEAVNIDARLKTGTGTKIMMPLSNAEEAEKSDFVRFITYENWKLTKKTEVFKAKTSGITMTFNLEITPDAEFQLVFNSQTGDVIRGKGKANLRLELTKQGDFLMYGQYTVVEGAYLFTALNIINKKFVIENGGTINWNGDALKAQMNMTAVYKVRTPLPPLITTTDETTAKRRIPVDCKLMLSGLLLQPDIKFDLNFPELNTMGGNSTAQATQAIQRLKGNQDEMNKQFFSLLMTGSFTQPDNIGQISSSGNSAVHFGSAAYQSAGDLLSNQLSNLLSQIDPNWDIGLNYQFQDESKQREMIISLSRRFLDDRLEVQTSSDVLRTDLNINFQAKYDLTDDGRLKLKAFSTNNSNLFNTQNVQTQGMGLYYSRQFNKIGEIFRRSEKKKKKKTDAKKVEDNNIYLPTDSTTTAPVDSMLLDNRGD
ncbi:MAG: translocation/assembly module TamB domain-containing protein [Bacteroidia bacterium]